MSDYELILAGAACATYGFTKMLPYLFKKGGADQRGTGVDFVQMDSRIKELHETLLEVKKK